jgi:hypothetical protein
MDWNTAYVLRQVATSFHKRLAFFAKFCHSVATVSDSFNKESPNGGGIMRTALIPFVDDQAPSADTLTSYDEKHRVTYLRLLDAEAEGAGWDEAALLVLRIDPIREPVRARRIWESHLARAKWLVLNSSIFDACF